MKKISLYGFLILCAWLAFSSQVYASSNHYLPGGKNYISKENLVYHSVDEIMSTENPFLVKPETAYVLSLDSRHDSPEIFLSIQFYFNDTAKGSLDIEKQLLDVDGQLLVSFHFSTPEDCNYISFDIENIDYIGSDPKSDSTFEIQLEEGIEPSAYESYIQGSMIDTSSPYFQSSGTIISYVDQPISLAEIQSALVAYDTIDGDVSSQINLISDNYSASSDVIGTYTIDFSVADTSGNLALFTVDVQVIDALAPVFSNLTDIQVIYPNILTEVDIINQLSVSDNYDQDVSANIQVIDDQYTSNAQVVGDYPMTFKVHDSSGNEATHELLVHVVDQEAPIIEGESLMTIGYNQYYEESELLSMLSVSDNYDTNLPIIIESNAYKTNSDLIGTYDVIFSVTDSSNNRTEKTMTIQVVDNIGPMVYLDKSVIQVYEDTILTLEDFAHLLRKTKELDPLEDYRITVRYDSYSKHTFKPGTYHMRLTFTDNKNQSIDKDFEINVIEKHAHDLSFGEQITSPSFFENHKDKLIYGGFGFIFIGSQTIWFIIYRKRKI